MMLLLDWNAMESYGRRSNHSIASTSMLNNRSRAINLFPGFEYFDRNFEIANFEGLNMKWLRFDPPTWFEFYLFGILYTIIFIFGCIGNLMTIAMFLHTKVLRTPGNVLIINLGLSDLLMILMCPMAIYNNFMGGPAAGATLCCLYGFLGGLSGTASIITLAAIAVDRHNVVTQPLNTNYRSSYSRPMCNLVFIWFYSGIFAILPAMNIGLSVYGPEGYLTTCGFDYFSQELPARIFMFVFFFGAYVVPLTIIAVSYYRIHKTVLSTADIQSSRDSHKVEQKLTKLIALIIGLWIVAWTPYSLVAMLGVFGQEAYITPFVSAAPALFCKVSACLNPFVYATNNKHFQSELKRICCCRHHHRFSALNLTSRRLRTSVISRTLITTTASSHELYDLRRLSFDSENLFIKTQAHAKSTAKNIHILETLSEEQEKSAEQRIIK